ncbi:hypothetical protein [Leadbetterella byssophila]|uniref:hypothetical protein n=1 Tax=Leadbetterella byssophila TaxID=316068 RepID=UPI00399F2AB4
MKTFKCMTKPPHDGKPLLAAVPSPIFELGVVPLLPHCKIIEREYRKDGKWHYGIINSYNGYGSGWADEDWVIGQVIKEQQRVARHGS